MMAADAHDQFSSANLWWKHGVVYQIYPRSFQDSNGDGIGDLQGVIDRLDYLNDGTPNSLGVDAIWFSPTYPSPMADFGYDVADYEDVHPDFGDLATMDRLITEAHKRGIRIILDFVPNHSSDKHAWFLESRSSKDNPKRDWYLWRDPGPAGEPPNNWIAVFGGPAWEYDLKTQQYYLHMFLKEQPDLNWRNAEVEQRMHDVLRFWLERGVDGFRIDVIDRIVKDPELRDNPPEPDRRFGAFAQTALQRHTQDQDWPDIIDYVRRIRKVVDEFAERMTVGEVFGTPENIVRYYGGETLDGLHMGFNFPLVRMNAARWTAERVRRYVETFEGALPAGCWPNWVLGNHDVDRIASRLAGDDGAGEARSRVAAMLLLTLRGTPFIYYGEELGMTDVVIPEDKLQDPARLFSRGRDPERTPMQWSRELGFTPPDVEPWLPYGDLSVNVEAQSRDPQSMLSLYRKLTWFRRGCNALSRGDYAAVDGTALGVFAYVRTFGDERVLVALNFTGGELALTLPEDVRVGEMVISTHADDGATGALRGHEGRVYRVL